MRRRLLRELGLADDAGGVAAAARRSARRARRCAGSDRRRRRRAPGYGGRFSAAAGIPVLPIDAISSGAGAGIPLLIGHNGNEGASYQLMDASSAGQAPRVLAELFGAQAAAAMLAAYAAARPELDETGIGVAVLGAERYGIPTHRLALAPGGARTGVAVPLRRLPARRPGRAGRRPRPGHAGRLGRGQLRRSGEVRGPAGARWPRRWLRRGPRSRAASRHPRASQPCRSPGTTSRRATRPR